MLFRKCLAAYFSSWAIVLLVSFPFMTVGGTSWHAAGTYSSWASVIALYAIPSIFLYGILISSLLELAIKKWKVTDSAKGLVSGFCHVVMGLLFGIMFQSSLFSIMGGIAAILFFGFDRIMLRFLPFMKRSTRILLLAVPVICFGLIVGTLYVSSPPKPPFTAIDAVDFATSGSGTTIDKFPKHIGMQKLQIEGYEVERETTVVETAIKEQYLVTFIERWRKEGEAGEQRMIYEVSRGTMGGKGGGGTEPPYQRTS
ncbi:hypothetical protein SAMN03159341_107134 [Paenibacillus sp. 1_12]|uniref:hypothetical protein n=1 Tax=Paenibacillus sp. 1_12 TaxID=1566278 RepID=UPI0008EDA6A0|nr:hypothetical protein [Paenibacillus sp. 1_12]SFL56003.1 hypothetical protein SAMN03159341_107134 [Paenibacillus sp. 1_12]